MPRPADAEIHMIVRQSESWLRTVFAIRTGTVLNQIWRRLLFVLGIAVAVTVVYTRFPTLKSDRVEPAATPW